MVVSLLAGTEDFVAGLDLVGMQNPFSVVTQRRRPPGHPAERVDVAHFEVRAVDRGDTMGAGGHQDAHQHVVVGVADVVARRLLPDLEGAHVQAGHQIRRAEHQRLYARRGRDRVDVGQAPGVFDLRLDSDAPHRQSMGGLELAEEKVERADVGGLGHLRQHDDVHRGTGARDHLDDVGVGPRRGPVVDAHAAQLARPPVLGQRFRHLGARLAFRIRCDRVLEIEKNLIGRQRFGFLDHLGAAARHGQTGAAGAIPVFHTNTLYS